MNTHTNTLSSLAGFGPVGEGTSGKVLNWTVRSLTHPRTTNASSGYKNESESTHMCMDSTRVTEKRVFVLVGFG